MSYAKRVSVLGTEYHIKCRDMHDENMDGYCDYTNHEICIRSDNANNVSNFEALQKKSLRHELVHAFLAESGLQANFQHCEEFGHEETMVDWVAIQLPKIVAACKEVGCL